jgi:hypothetical protein
MRGHAERREKGGEIHDGGQSFGHGFGDRAHGEAAKRMTDENDWRGKRLEIGHMGFAAGSIFSAPAVAPGVYVVRSPGQHPVRKVRALTELLVQYLGQPQVSAVVCSLTAA